MTEKLVATIPQSEIIRVCGHQFLKFKLELKRNKISIRQFAFIKNTHSSYVLREMLDIYQDLLKEFREKTGLEIALRFGLKNDRLPTFGVIDLEYMVFDLEGNSIDPEQLFFVVQSKGPFPENIKLEIFRIKGKV